jgi:hypothetical protein
MRWAKKIKLNVNKLTLPKFLTPQFISNIGTPFFIVEQVFNDMYKLELMPDI